MKTKLSQLLNIILATILVSSLFFMNIRVNTSGDDEIASGIEYDPWIDLNDDGVIDVTDYQLVKSHIPTMGNPTKNVNITNFPLDEQGNLKVNVNPRGDLTLCQAAERIVLLESFNLGIPVEIYSSEWWESIYFAEFAFTPKQGYNNTIRIVVQAIGSCEDSAKHFNSSISVWHGGDYAHCKWIYFTWLVEPYPYQLYWKVDPTYDYPDDNGHKDVLDTIGPGRNFISIRAAIEEGWDSFTISIFRIELLIEYTYWNYVE